MRRRIWLPMLMGYIWHKHMVMRIYAIYWKRPRGKPTLITLIFELYHHYYHHHYYYYYYDDGDAHF